ncbi:MAG TPA: translocation/assembly module TamB domain-containing protein [Steroidobacteraceae bacterium]
MHRRIGIAGLALLALLIAATGAALYAITDTEAGLRYVLAHLPRQLGPITLEVTGARGTLLHGLRVERVVVDHERVRVTAEGVAGRITLLPLLWQTIDVHDLSLRSAYIDVHPHIDKHLPWTPRFLPALLTIRAARVRCDALTITTPSGKHFDASSINASGAVLPKRILVFDAAMSYGQWRGTGTGELRAADPLQLQGDTRWTWTPPDQPHWTASAAGNGSLERLAIVGHIEAPFRADVEGTLLDLTGNWHWSALGHLKDLNLETWGAGHVFGQISGELKLAGDGDGFRAQGPVDSRGLGVGLFDATFDGFYADQTLTARRMQLVHRASQASASASGTIGIVAHGPRLQLRGGWRDFRWPLVGKAVAIRSSEGRFSLGGIWPYTLEAEGPLQLPDFAPMPSSVKGELAKDQLHIAEGTLRAFAGLAHFESNVRWAPTESWSVRGNMVGLDPARLRPGFPGKLRFDFLASGDALSAATNLDLTLSALSGRVRGVAARGGGRFLRRGALWQFDKVHADGSGLHVALDGRLGAQRDLRFDIEVADLSLLAPETRGAARARGELHGTPAVPIISLTASAKNVHYQKLALGSLAADISFDPHPQRASKASIHLQDLAYGEHRTKRLDATFDGTPEDYRLALRSAGTDTTVALAANGPFGNGIWRPTVHALTVDQTDRLHLKLESPVALTLSLHEARAATLCLKGEEARLCTEGGWHNGEWAASVDASHLPLASLTAGMSPDVAYTGALSVVANAAGHPSKSWSGTARVDLVEAAIHHRLVSGRDDVIALGSGQLTAQANGAQFTAGIELDAREVGTIHGALTAQRTTDTWADMPLRGDLRASTAALGFLSLYLPQIDRAAGKLDVDLAVGGTLGTPLLSGVLKLANGELDFYQVSLALRQVALEARFLDNRLDVSGQALAGEGTAHLTGSLSWHGGEPSGALSLVGENLRLVNVPEARVEASPTLKFAVDGRRINVTGEVKIPYARLVPADLTGAVLPSGDEVIVGEPVSNPAERFVVSSEITLALGDRVTIDTFGLSGRLTGTVTVTTGADQVSRGRGELKVEEGKYFAYARKLDVERGRLIFNGGLVADPAVDIRAVKVLPDVTAGVNVRGTLRAPRLSFFSEPSLPQSQILSLILAGGSLETVQNADRTGAARSEALAQGGAIIAQQLGQRIGIEDVSIEQDLTNSTSLVLGKYLSPKLYVSYGVSLTEAINTIKTRYTLGDRWTIRTEAGRERSADLVFTIEK